MTRYLGKREWAVGKGVFESFVRRAFFQLVGVVRIERFAFLPIEISPLIFTLWIFLHPVNGLNTLYHIVEGPLWVGRRPLLASSAVFYFSFLPNPKN